MEDTLATRRGGERLPHRRPRPCPAPAGPSPRRPVRRNDDLLQGSLGAAIFAAVEVGGLVKAAVLADIRNLITVIGGSNQRREIAAAAQQVTS